MKWIEMYFDRQITQDFAEHEQNEKNFTVAAILDTVICHTIQDIDNTFKAIELWWWAHPDRYHYFFDKLIEWKWHIDRIDISPYMLEIAPTYLDTPEYRQRLDHITFIQSDIIQYLQESPDKSIDLAIMKYTIDHLKEIDTLFFLLSKKLKDNGVLISNIGVLAPELKSISTNARFLHNWEEFPETETRVLQDGDNFTVKFFKESWNPAWWYIPGAQTTKYFHTEENYRKTAQKYWFDLFIWNRKEYIADYAQKYPNIELDQNILVLKNTKTP